LYTMAKFCNILSAPSVTEPRPPIPSVIAR
jgi:hypothetical protein